MVEVRYVPATGTEPWRVALAPATVVALPPNVSIPTVEAVWRRLGERGIGAVIEALTGAFGTSLAAIPDFVLVIAEEGGLRVALRGPVELVVETATEPVAISGTGVSTWVERWVPDAHRATAVFGEGADDTLALPVVQGIVAADAVAVSLAAMRPLARPAAAPEPAAPEAPAPEPAEPAGPAEPAADAEADAGDREPAVDSVPVALIVQSAEPAPVEPAPAETVVPSTGETAAADDHLAIWGETIVRESPAPNEAPSDPHVPLSPEDEATIVSTPPAVVPMDAAAAPRAGDHDGETIAVADIRAMRRGAAGDAGAAVYESTEIPAPRRRGRIRISDGQVIELDATVIVGRRPRSPRATGDALPTLVAVESPEQDISRNHLEIRAEGEHVLAVDLDTTNGSVLLRGGHDPVRLHPGEPTMIVGGDVIDIGDGVTISFEDLA
ncbi:FHA domain-containing protein [Microbacterium radiodurans]|uniref:FHA domain-containing protein n=1 Tax=Microbacterium radiodurans TaxID=661398 RepID=A0A5J5IU40_9MICO|nr:FHA domain-containing protein [Microbacterium radiodurans]KAA9089428.1 FHA domain-containing protein [Microbacterium radiodurans]